MMTFRAWLDATRPKTLVAAVAPVALGGAVFAAYGKGASEAGVASEANTHGTVAEQSRTNAVIAVRHRSGRAQKLP